MKLSPSVSSTCSLSTSLKLVMRPHADNLHGLFFLQNFVHQTMLNIQPPRICTLQTASQILIRRWFLKWILPQNLDKRLRFFRQMHCLEFRHIRRRGFRIDDSPAHHVTLSADRHSSVEVFSPSTIFFCMPGTAQSSIVAIRSL